MLLPLAAVAAVSAAEHPTLVDLESTTCTVCHEDLLEDRATVHVPVQDDCATCHEMSESDEGWRVALLDDEPSLCLTCHDDLAPAVEAELDVPHYPVTESCLTCHDPHATGGPHLLSAPVAELCGTCHEIADIQEPHGGQLTPAANCVTCHQPHGSANATLLTGSRQHRPFAEGSCSGCHRAPSRERVRLRTRGERLCTACHGDLADLSGDSGTTHAALKGPRGRAGCLSCHDPHMSEQRALLVSTGSVLCAQCHGDLVEAAGAETGHAPAAEDCLNCHRPHTSELPGLLDAPAGELCRTCHDVSDEELTGAHLGADLGPLDCLSCHTPHGSGNEKLLAAVLHPPLLDGCDTCHEGSASQIMEEGDSDLCLICHDDVGAAAEQVEVPHAALEVAACADCHNPHASAQASLVKSPGDSVCTGCHDDQAAGAGEVLHGIIGLVGCQACHEPHGSENPKLLRLGGNDLCLACHDPSRLPEQEEADVVSLLGRFEVPATAAKSIASLRLSPDGLQGHPVPGHRVLGTPTEEELKSRNVESTFEGEFTCLTCHDPHKGRSKDIFRWEAASSMDLCLHCHPK